MLHCLACLLCASVTGELTYTEAGKIILWEELLLTGLVVENYTRFIKISLARSESESAAVN